MVRDRYRRNSTSSDGVFADAQTLAKTTWTRSGARPRSWANTKAYFQAGRPRLRTRGSNQDRSSVFSQVPLASGLSPALTTPNSCQLFQGTSAPRQWTSRTLANPDLKGADLRFGSTCRGSSSWRKELMKTSSSRAIIWTMVEVAKASVSRLASAARVDK